VFRVIDDRVGQAAADYLEGDLLSRMGRVGEGIPLLSRAVGTYHDLRQAEWETKARDRLAVLTASTK
jgi:hypothetical protein